MNTIITGFEAKLTPYSNTVKKKVNLSLESRFFKRIQLRYEKESLSIQGSQISLFDHEKVLKKLQTTYETDVCLRVLRQLVLQKLLVLDCEYDLTLEEVMVQISYLAEFTLLKASECANVQLNKLYGVPTKDDGSVCQIVIMAMGKLGAKELNVSSDVDLVYVYESDGQTKIEEGSDRQRSISNQEYYLKWSMAMQKIISEVTEHGFVFRIDLELRPYGKASATVLPFTALERYFQTTARAWERFAWLKARILGLDKSDLRDNFDKKIYSIIDSFVYRQYADFQLMESLREIHVKIQKQADVTSNLRDVKLGRGGIREIEFGVQLLQVIHAGTRPELRTRSTFKAFKYLEKYKVLTKNQCDQWEIAYRFLRTLEHRVQYLDDQQTHKLPQIGKDLEWIAKTMGFEDLQQFEKSFVEICNYVQAEFDLLVNIRNQNKEIENIDSNESGKEDEFIKTGKELIEQIKRSSKNQLDETKEVISNISTLCEKWSNHLQEPDSKKGSINIEKKEISLLKLNKKQWLIKLIKKHCEYLRENKVTSLEVNYWFDWVDAIFKRDNYLALQNEHPKVQIDITHLMGASSWCRRYLKYYPSVVEQMVHDDGVLKRLESKDFIELLNKRRSSLNLNLDKGDEEQLLRMLRREHHACLFRILAADLNGQISIEEISDDLSELAQGVLSVCVDWLWERINTSQTVPRELNNPPLAIIGYGKFGSKELGYGSDLDLVLLYDENEIQFAEQIPLLARRLISWITVKTSDGDLYEIDNALRPNGSAGLLVSSFESFERYQRQLDQNSAWTWEHQALTRARFCVGTSSLKERFEKIRHDVLSKRRTSSKLLNEVFEMRKKLWFSHKYKPGIFNGKYSPGGMIDVEFVVQYLILANANQCEDLIENIGNIGLLKLAENKGLIPATVGYDAANAYRQLRKRQHAARLQEKIFEISDESLKESTEKIKKLWLCFFDAYW
jgi:glutamate-ammonia-ligase adenylyltransferase